MYSNHTFQKYLLHNSSGESLLTSINKNGQPFNTLWTGDADLRLYITTVQDG